MFTLFLLSLAALTFGPVGQDAAREPQLAVSGNTVLMTFGAGSGIYFSRSADAGRTFSSPVRVAEGAILPLNRHRGPRIAVAGHTILISAVTGRTLSHEPHAHGLPSDGDLMAWRSTDGGATWSKGVVVNDVPGAPSEGLQALAANATGDVFAVWLDKRGGNGTKLYGARSADAGATWLKSMAVYESPDGTICQCCHPSAAMRPDGAIFVMFRNCLGESRDMYVTRSLDGARFTKPEKLGTGTWLVNACPMDGGGLSVSGAGVITAWRRESGIFLDVPGRPEQTIGTGKDVALTVSQAHTYAIWSASSGIVVWANGRSENIASSGAFPTIAPLPDGGAIAAWETDSHIVIRVIE